MKNINYGSEERFRYNDDRQVYGYIGVLKYLKFIRPIFIVLCDQMFCKKGLGRHRCCVYLEQARHSVCVNLFN